MMKPDLSVIIVNFNTRDFLRKCLSSVVEGHENIQYEIIVVDNNSSDGSSEMITREFPNVVLICNNENSGFAAANNIGLKKTNAELILLLNSDTVLNTGVLSSSVRYMQSHADTGILGIKILNPDGTIQSSARDFPTLWTIFLETFFLYKLFRHSGIFRNPWITDVETEQEVDLVKGAYFLIRRQVIDQIGPLDERFFLYSEEQDWCLRAKRSGWHIMYLPAIGIYHHDGGSSFVQHDSAKYFLFESEFKYFQKHFGMGYAIATRILTVIGIVLRLILWFPTGVFQKITSGQPTRSWNKVRYYWFAILWHLKRTN